MCKLKHVLLDAIGNIVAEVSQAQGVQLQPVFKCLLGALGPH